MKPNLNLILIFISLTLAFGFSALSWAVSTDAHLNWLNLTTEVQEDPAQDEPKKLLPTDDSKSSPLTHVEGVRCDPYSELATNRNCHIFLPHIKSMSAGFSADSGDQSYLRINGETVKLTLSCESESCLLANPTLLQCSMLANQARWSEKVFEIHIIIETGTRERDFVNEVNSGKVVSLVLGSSFVRRLFCSIP